MEQRTAVTAFLRNRSDVLLLRRSDAVGSYAGRWNGVSGQAEDAPDDAVRREIREETGFETDAVEFVRRGESFPVADEQLGIRWRIHPFLFDCIEHQIEPNWETQAFEWVSPTAVFERETVPKLWESYDRVRPTVETVAEDERHGASSLSARALEVLRDEAALSAAGRADTSWEDLSVDARALRDARPSMTVVANRVNRTMSSASVDGKTPAAIEQAATGELERLHRARQAAATTAAASLDGKTVGTLSRSGTVLAALEQANPPAVLLAESRPGREGVGVAEELAHTTDVRLTTDAAFPSQVLAGAVDVVLVGADTILADGRVCNKVGTAGAAAAASVADVPVSVVAATDKISPGTGVETGERDAGELYDGTAAVSVENPTFDVTPPEFVDAVFTEEGRLETAEVQRVGTAHAEYTDWE